MELGGVACVGWLYSDYNANLSSNWTELDWTGTELGNMRLYRMVCDSMGQLSTKQDHLKLFTSMHDVK